MSHTDIQPIPVTVANAGDLGAPARRHRRATPRTRNLTAANPRIHLCAYDETRLYLQIQCGGNNIVLCNDISMAQDPSNLITGVPDPDGFLLAAGNTVPFKLEGCEPWWAVATLFPAQVTWITVHESRPDVSPLRH